MNNLDLTLIERYYRAELTEADRVAFEKRVAEDAEFKEETELHKLALEAIRLHALDQFRKQLRERPLIKRELPRRRYWLWASLAGTATLIIVLWIFWPPEDIRPSPNPTIIQPSIEPQQTPEITSPIADNHPQTREKPNLEALYASTYRAYKEGSGNTRGSDPQSQDTSDLAKFKTMKQLAESDKFKESLEIFEKLSPKMKNSNSAVFYKANNLMALNNVEEAAPLFEAIASNPNNPYASQSQWYAALCALKNKDVGKVKIWLGMITAEGSYASADLRTKAKNMMIKLR